MTDETPVQPKEEKDFTTCGWAKAETKQCLLHKGEVDEAQCYHCCIWGHYWVRRLVLVPVISSEIE